MFKVDVFLCSVKGTQETLDKEQSSEVFVENLRQATE